MLQRVRTAYHHVRCFDFALYLRCLGPSLVCTHMHGQAGGLLACHCLYSVSHALQSCYAIVRATPLGRCLNRAQPQ